MRLKQKGITHVIVVGLLANTCIELTARFAMELGYHVTLVRDATAAFTDEMMHAAHELNGPTFAHSILTTSQDRTDPGKQFPEAERLDDVVVRTEFEADDAVDFVGAMAGRDDDRTSE